MEKKNNLIAEIRKITQQIQADYQEELKKTNHNNNSINNNKSSQFENKTLWLVGGITLGVIISALVAFCRCRKSKKNK